MKIIQLNIERNKHLHRILPFLQEESADVVMLQEVFQEDARYIADQLHYAHAFAPMTRYSLEKRERIQGIAIFSKKNPLSTSRRYYFGDENVPRYLPIKRETVCQPLLIMTIEDTNGDEWNIGTLHFGKSWRGVPDSYQRKMLKPLREILLSYNSIFFGGDFNIPRGTELYAILQNHFLDHIPPSFTNSLDPTLHRIPHISHMVDYFWSTNDFSCQSVRQKCNLSDHCAFIVQAEKSPKSVSTHSLPNKT